MAAHEKLPDEAGYTRARRNAAVLERHPEKAEDDPDEWRIHDRTTKAGGQAGGRVRSRGVRA